MKENIIHISQSFNSRLDVSFYQEKFDFSTKSYTSIEIDKLLDINPTIKLNHLSNNDLISFIPMEAIDEINGIVSKYASIKVANCKGFTKFENNDLLWAKITPCMQNGKSAIVRGLENGIGCGSTEFYVLRPKSNNILIEYIHYILRDQRILESAKNSFGGSAGQQRVSISYLKSIKIPLLPIEVQKSIVDLYSIAQQKKQETEQEAKDLLISVDSFILNQIGINLPKKQDYQSDHLCLVNISNLLGERYDPYYHKSYFEKAFNELKKSKYELKTLKDLSTVITSGITPLSGGDAYTNQENGVAFIRSGDIDINGDINFNNLLYIKPEIHNKKMKSSKVYNNDIMIAIVGATIGQVGIYHSEKEANINQAIALVRLKEEINHEYIKELIKSAIGQLNLDRLKRPVARANINLEEVASIIIPIPPIEVQNEIANAITKIRSRAKQLQQEGTMLLDEAKAKIERIILG